MLTCLTRIINEFEFGLVNVNTFIIRVEFKFANIDTIRILSRYEYYPSTRIATPTTEKDLKDN